MCLLSLAAAGSQCPLLLLDSSWQSAPQSTHVSVHSIASLAQHFLSDFLGPGSLLGCAA